MLRDLEKRKTHKNAFVWETHLIHITFIKLISQSYSKLLEVIYKMTVIHRKVAKEHCGILCFPQRATTLFSGSHLLLVFCCSQWRVKLCNYLYEWDAPSVFICSWPPSIISFPLPIPLPSSFSLYPLLSLGCFFPWNPPPLLWGDYNHWRGWPCGVCFSWQPLSRLQVKASITYRTS